MRHPDDCHEPGAGEQIQSIATTPGDDMQNGVRVNGRYWKCGHDYLDTEIGDVCTLVEVIRRSPWCSHDPPEEHSAELLFVYERYNEGREVTIDANDRTIDFDERFVERFEQTSNRRYRAEPW